MKNIQTKYKLNFKTMKKGLLTLLAASLVFVGCQNYDDQFDDLNAQISALKSQVDGLSSLSGQVSSLSGTISGLQAGVSAAQASAASAASAANAITPADLSGLEASLATLKAEVDAVQASLATAATASAVAALQTELDALEADLDELLSTSNIYSSDVTITNATTLNSALALGNKINVLNATFTVTGYAGMDYAKVQTLVDRLVTVTGNVSYTAAGNTGTEVVFTNLVSAGNVTAKQPGGYSFPALANAAIISLDATWASTITNINLPVLVTATGLRTGNTVDTVNFPYATNVDLGSMAVSPNETAGGKLAITTKKGATLDIGVLVNKDSNGDYLGSYDLDLTGPASVTLGTASGTFASTGLAGNTVGVSDGNISLTNVATAAVHNFRGILDVNAGVENLTVNNGVHMDFAGASDLTTVNLTLMYDNDPGNDATTTANNAKDGTANTNNMTFNALAKLTSLTITGKAHDINVTSNTALTSVDFTNLTAFDIDFDGNTDLSSITLTGAKLEDVLVDNNDLLTSLTLNHTTTMTGTDKGAKISITGNAELLEVTGGFNTVDNLTIQSNPKLAKLTGWSALTTPGTGTAATVTINQNAFVADSVRDTKEATTLTAAQVGTSTDTGAITTTSGLEDFDTYLAAAAADTGTVSVWFDTITKLETQAAYGGSFTDVTADITAPANWDSTEAVLFASPYTGYHAYFYQTDGDYTSTTIGKRDAQKLSFAYDRVRNATTLIEQQLLDDNAEGFTLVTDAGTFTFDEGDAYAGGTAGLVETVSDLVSYLDTQTQTSLGANIEVSAALDGYNKAIYSISYTNSTASLATAGAVSTGGNLYFSFGKDLDGADKDATLYLIAALDAADDDADIADAVMTAINADGLYAASSITNGTNGAVFMVTRNVSGTSTMDTSPLTTISSFPSIVFDTATASNTAILTPSGYDAVINSTSVSAINSRGTASSFYSVAATAPTLKSGVRVTLTNNTGAAFSAAVSF